MRASERERPARERAAREGGERKRRERAARESGERERRERERERSMVCEGCHARSTARRLRRLCLARSLHACLFQVFAVSTEAAGKRPRQQAAGRAGVAGVGRVASALSVAFRRG